MTKSKPPKVFISYAWEEDTKIWTHDFATRLRSDGIDTILDQWHVLPGDSLPEFMEKSVSKSDFVLIICTPEYKRKSKSKHPSGVIYEKGVITGELFVKRNQRKFIPVLRKGKWKDAAPSWILAKTYIDLSDNPYSENNYNDLLQTIYGERKCAPPLGPKPDFSKKVKPKKTTQKLLLKIVFFIALSGIMLFLCIIGISSTPYWINNISQTTMPVVSEPVSENKTSIAPPNMIDPMPTATFVTLPSPTPIPTSINTPISTATAPLLKYTTVNANEVLNASIGLKTLGELAYENYSQDERDEANTLFFTIDAHTNTAMLWRWYWCAKDRQTLEQNMQYIDVVFEINGQAIPKTKFVQLIFTSGDPAYSGWKCSLYETVIKDWDVGTYTLRQITSRTTLINDGKKDFPAGEKIYEYTVNISK